MPISHPAGPVRAAAFAGQWYPGTAAALSAAVDRYLVATEPPFTEILGLICPHAGLMYSGHVGGRGYALVAGRDYDVVALVGPSHYVAFDGIAVWPEGRFDTPLGPLTIDADVASRLVHSDAVLRMDSRPHVREHSLELQLPFLARVMPRVPIVAVLMGRQTRSLVDALAAALAGVLRGRRSLLVASSDLSHYQDRTTARRLDQVVLDHVGHCDADGLQATLEHFPGHACGGGPMVAVMRAATALGGTGASIVHYADSGDVSGDVSQVVGYMSAAIGRSA